MVADRGQLFAGTLTQLRKFQEVLQNSLDRLHAGGPLPDEIVRMLTDELLQPDLNIEGFFSCFFLFFGCVFRFFNLSLSLALTERRQKLETEIEEVSKKLAEEEAKTKKRQKDNVRRKFNYFPFMVEMLKILGKKGELTELIRLAEGT